MTLVLETQRLRMTPVTTADLDLALEMFTDPDVMRFIGGTMSEADVRAEMALWTKRGGEGGVGIWCIADRLTNETFGSGFLLPVPIEDIDTNWDNVVPGIMPEGDVEVGYTLKQSAWGKGYATEACQRLIRFAFEETPLQEVVATFDDDNTASRNVLAKSGLKDCGRRRAYRTDCPDWRITRQEWAAANTRAHP
ncbi:MAG: GNAT family N-acetyltransferase [Pseudomonadota bacterium]